MPKINTKRRSLLTAAALLPLAPIANALAPTPSAMEGPFYPTSSMRFDDVDNDLVKIEGAVSAAGGEVIQLNGKLVDSDGDAVSNAIVEIWQCDATGRYLHTADRRAEPRDAGFQGFGRARTAVDGRFTFRTIKPVPYPGRTPHIHVKVVDQGFELLTSQLYLDGHPGNSRDFLFNRMSPEQQQQVSMRFDQDPAQTDVLLVV
jgi:protocatechuate 3,4-dioxygenase beta subunit